MQNNYTKSVQDSIDYAYEIAREKGSNHVGTEHLLYGISKAEEGIATELLNDYGVTSDKIFVLIKQESAKKNLKLTETGKYKEIFALSEENRKKLELKEFGTEFLLFGIMKQAESSAVSILKQLCKDFQGLFNELLKVINSLSADTENELDNSALSSYGRNLNELAKNGKIEKIIGRDKEIQRIIQVLGRKNKNNPCVIGDAGVGKTAIVEGLAYNIVKGDVPQELKNKHIISLDLSLMIAGSKYRGEFEERIKKILEEAENLPDVILFIDEIHTIIGAGSAEGTLDVANILKPVLARGDIKIIGATTINEYRKHIEKDEALERRFQKVLVEEPTKAETLEILKGIKGSYEKFHNVLISDEVLLYVVEVSGRYINSRCFPDKAIDLLDETCAYCKSLVANKKSKNAKEDDKEPIDDNNFEEAIKLAKKAEKKTNEVALNKSVREITTQDVAKVLSNMIDIPVDEISKDEISKLKNLESNLSKQIIGQEEAIKLLSKAVKRGRSGIKDPKKPIGSFLFLGPTGCGKTETCKALAKLVFNSEDDIIKFDMSEYMEKHSVSKLIGAPPGYVGYEEGGLLTERVSKKPYSIVLFDEIEKAHPDIFNVLLQVLDEGTLTDSNGRKVDFKNTIIILTSNIGAKELFTNKKLGFTNTNSKSEKEDTKKSVMSEIKKSFNPEFINRLDEIVIFNKLTKEDIEKIADILIKETLSRISGKIDVIIDADLKNKIIDEGFSEEYGARPLKRSIKTYIENPIADYLIEHNSKRENCISVSYENGEVKIKWKNLEM